MTGRRRLCRRLHRRFCCFRRNLRRYGFFRLRRRCQACLKLQQVTLQALARHVAHGREIFPIGNLEAADAEPLGACVVVFPAIQKMVFARDDPFRDGLAVARALNEAFGRQLLEIVFVAARVEVAVAPRIALASFLDAFEPEIAENLDLGLPVANRPHTQAALGRFLPE
jgi:hypothetical protein